MTKTAKQGIAACNRARKVMDEAAKDLCLCIIHRRLAEKSKLRIVEVGHLKVNWYIIGQDLVINDRKGERMVKMSLKDLDEAVAPFFRE